MMKHPTCFSAYRSYVVVSNSVGDISSSTESKQQDDTKPIFLYSINPDIAVGISIFVMSFLVSVVVLLGSGTYHPQSVALRAILNFAFIGLITSGIILSVGSYRWPVRMAHFYNDHMILYGWRGHMTVNFREIKRVERYTRSFGIWPRTSVTYVNLFIKDRRLPISIPNRRSKKLGIDLYSWLTRLVD
jgi:hypothetical protein